MILREVLTLGAMLLLFVLFGVGWYAMTRQPDKYRSPSTWLYGTAILFLLSVVLLFLLIGKFDFESIIFVLGFGLFGSVGMAISLWITLFQRDRATKWLDSRRGDRKAK